MPQGTPILAWSGGTVVTRGNQPKGAGYYITIKHSDGLQTQYMHLSRQDVNKGDVVKAGQVIGLSGGKRGAPGSGNTTGPHLHFTFKINGKQSYDGNVYKSLLAKSKVVNVSKA